MGCNVVCRPKRNAANAGATTSGTSFQTIFIVTKNILFKLHFISHFQRYIKIMLFKPVFIFIIQDYACWNCVGSFWPVLWPHHQSSGSFHEDTCTGFHNQETLKIISYGWKCSNKITKNSKQLQNEESKHWTSLRIGWVKKRKCSHCQEMLPKNIASEHYRWTLLRQGSKWIHYLV